MLVHFQAPNLKHNKSFFSSFHMLSICVYHLESVPSIPSTLKENFSSICLVFIDFMKLEGEIKYYFVWPLPEMNLWYCSEQRNPGSWIFQFSFIFSVFYYFLTFVQKQDFFFSPSSYLTCLKTSNPKVQLFSDSLSIDQGPLICLRN